MGIAAAAAVFTSRFLRMWQKHSIFMVYKKMPLFYFHFFFCSSCRLTHNLAAVKVDLGQIDTVDSISGLSEIQAQMF